MHFTLQQFARSDATMVKGAARILGMRAFAKLDEGEDLLLDERSCAPGTGWRTKARTDVDTESG